MTTAAQFVRARWPGYADLLVIDADEKQAVRRRGLAGAAAVAGGEHFGGPVDVALAAADFDQRADDRADHVVEEAVAGDFDGDAVGIARRRPRADRRVSS